MDLTEEQRAMLARRTVARVKDYRVVFNSEEGRRVLYDMMNSHYVLQQSFNTDAIRMAYNEGQRAVIWKILHYLKTDERQLLKIIEEREKYEHGGDSITNY